MKLLTKLFGRQFYRRIIASLLAYVMFLNALVSVTIAGPEGAQVVNGQVSIQQSGSNTAITASDKAIINYSSFDIARPETVQFIQPGSNASVLNRILSANPTNINGTLLANGRVFFVNPAGVYIGDGARINVNQFVASALNISNSDFINGNYNFAGGNGAVINDGDISAQQVYLIGKQVTNSGNINCPAGYVVMAAGDRVFLGEPGSDIVLDVEGTSLSESATSEVGVLNDGTVDAAGGIIALAAAGDIYSQAISNVGSLSTSVDSGDAGQIKLAAAGGEVVNTGTIGASGSEGGQVAMEGARVGQFGTIHANGTTGDGGNINLTAGEVVALSSDSLTTANAGTNGNGGEVIVYSPDTALFRPDARIEARGGDESGDGGFVEVSGKKHVEIYGSVNTMAPGGNAGSFLIDPYNVTISSDSDDPAWDTSGDPYVFTPTGNNSTINVTTLQNNLSTANVVVTTNTGAGPQAGNITVADSISYGSPANNNLTLQADNDIFVNSTITAGDNNLTLQATGNVEVSSAISMTSGSFTSSGVDFASGSSGTITTTSGNVDLSGHTGAVDIDAAINSGGSVDIAGSSISISSNIAGVDINFGNAVTADGAGLQTFDAGTGTLTVGNITKTTAGTLTLGGNAAVNLSGDARATAAAGNLTFTDTVTVNGTGGQVLDAEDGTLTANDGVNITKTTAGTLTLGGNTALNLGGDVRATVAGGNLTFADTVTVNGTGGHVLDAENGTLTMNDGIDITKTTTGTLTFGGNTAVNLGGDARATAAGGNLTFADNVSVNGTGAQVLDAENGTLAVNDGVNITKTTAGTLTLGGNTALNLGDDVKATAAGGNLTFADNVTANGTGGQVLDAEDGILTSNDGVNITKTTAGALTLGGKTAIHLGGDVRATAAGGDLVFADNVTLNGTGGQVLDAENGTLIMNSGINITKTTAGTLTLGSNAGLNINGNVMATNASGNLAIEDNATIADGITLQAGNDIMVAAGKTLTAEGDLTLVATNGGISEKAGDDGKVQIDMTLDNQTLALTENDNVNMSGFSVINDEHTNLVIDSTSGSAIVIGSAADDWFSITAAAEYNVVLSGDGDIRTGKLESRDTGGSTGVQIFTDTGSGGSLEAQGTITSGGFVSVDVEGSASFADAVTAGGNIELETESNMEINDDLTATGGGVSLISYMGKIYTSGGADDTLNVKITGYSDTSGAGINLPFGLGKTAISIMSKDDLKLGTNTTLTANGEYSISVDDRPGVGFDISPSVGGEPIDVAIYLRSFRSDPPPSTPSDPGGHVAVKSKVTIADYGTMVVDAGEKVTFEEKFNESEFYQTNRLEVVSRRSETLEAVILNNRLPYAKNPEAIREWFNETPTGYFAGAYVLRGAKTVLAEVLDLANPVPLALPRPLEPEFQGEVERPDTGALEELLNELGIGVQPYVTDAYAASLSTDLRLYSAAEKLQQLIPVLEDADGTRIAGLRTTVAQFFPSLDVLSEENMDSFAQELTRHEGDGSDYDLTGQCIFALIEYVNILGTDIGWPVEKSVGFVMGRYVPRLTEGDEIRIAVIQMQLQKALGV